MKKLLPAVAFALLALCFPAKMSSQTAGTLTFSFMPVVKTPTYNGNSQHVMAAWIQSSTGTFVKTKLRYIGSGTSDHLPTWAANCGCASSTNALGTACNKTDATTGATLSSWAASTFTWDAHGVSGTANGPLMADGVYKVTIQETWNHGTSGTATSSYTFTKGPAADHQTPANNTTFTGVMLDWAPTVATGIESDPESPEIAVYPNPTDGVFNVDFIKASSIRVINTLGVVVYEAKVDASVPGTKSIDLSNFANGIYLISVSNSQRSSNHRVILNK